LILDFQPEDNSSILKIIQIITIIIEDLHPKKNQNSILTVHYQRKKRKEEEKKIFAYTVVLLNIYLITVPKEINSKALQVMYTSAIQNLLLLPDQEFLISRT